MWKVYYDVSPRAAQNHKFDIHEKYINKRATDHGNEANMQERYLHIILSYSKA